MVEIVGYGKMWRVVKGMYEVSRSAVLLDGKTSSVEQGVYSTGL